jgi:hypothetical protein
MQHLGTEYMFCYVEQRLHSFRDMNDMVFNYKYISELNFAVEEQNAKLFRSSLQI